MATTFRQLIQKELQGKIKANSQDALLLSELKTKKGLLQGTIELRGTQAFDDETFDALDVAAEELAERLIDEILAEGDGRTQRTSGKVKVGSIAGLRTKRGTIISALKLKTLLNVVLQKYIRELMGTGTRLVYRTGRLANSAEVSSLEEESGSDRVSLYFSYMVYPYATFEKGGKQFSPGRPPSELIDEALSDALEDILNTSSYKRITTVFGGS